MAGNHRTVFKGLAHLELSQVTSWWPPAATGSFSSHCSPPSPARAFSCPLHRCVPLSLHYLPASVSVLSQQVTRNVLHLPPSGFMSCPSNEGERRTTAQYFLQRCMEEAWGKKCLPGPVEATLLSSSHCVFVDWTYTLTVLHWKVFTIASLFTANHVILTTDTTCTQVLASLCAGAEPRAWSAALSLNTCKTLP